MPIRPRNEWVIAHSHHEAYVSHEEFQRIQDLLASARRDVRPPLGNGPGELQGLLWCGPCDGRMNTLYWRHEKGHHSPSYSCRRVDADGNYLHQVQLITRVLDDAVRGAVLSALTPTTIEAAIAVIEQQHASTTDILRTQRRQVQHAEDEVEAAKRRYKEADPANKAVRAELGLEWEQALHRRDELKRSFSSTGSSERKAITRVTAEELVELTRDIRMLWNAETTTNQDRKQLLQTVLSKVYVRAVAEDAIELELVWSGGLRQSVRALRSKGVNRLIIEKRRHGSTSQRIAEELNADGLRDAYGKPFSATSVRQRIHTLGISLKVERQTMMFTLHVLLCKRAGAAEVLHDLQSRTPRAAPRTHEKLKIEILRLRRGFPGAPALPPDAVAWARSRSFWAHEGS
jgi:hypothetical protein